MSEGIERWAGKVALVTGATSGIGEAMARALAGIGCKVALTGRRAERLQALERQLAAGGAAVLALPADLRLEPAILGLFQVIRQRWGGVDVLINNAGLGYNANKIATAAREDWREMLDLNVMAVLICTQEALKDMAGKQDAAIINISSLAGHRVVPGRTETIYAACKFAVRAITEGLRSELQAQGSPVKLASISPGMVATEFHARAARGAKVTPPAYKLLDPKDIADAALYMLSTPRHVQVNDILLRPVGQPH
ncbi:MAG TPA: SDR family NAD(P)-dependent oxidoreductase [bacterium]|nr:SDR family NAD(P)-dependent oxidoreductase [bacterium]